MMYRREAPKPVREAGFILPLIGCGCMCRGPVYQFGTQCAPNSVVGNSSSQEIKKGPMKVWGLGVWITMSFCGNRGHLVVFTFLRPKYFFKSEKLMPFVSSAIFVLRSLINPTASNSLASFFTVFLVFIIYNFFG